jgi:hypothetical protein
MRRDALISGFINGSSMLTIMSMASISVISFTKRFLMKKPKEDSKTGGELLTGLRPADPSMCSDEDQ